MRVSSTPNAIALSGLAVSAIDAAIRVGDPGFLHPAERRAGVEHRFGGGEGLRRDHDQGRVRIEVLDRLLERGAVDIGDDRNVVAAGVAAERVDQQLGAERRAADADMEDVADRAERLGLDRVDQRAHPRVERPRRGRRFRGAPSPRSARCSAARPSVGLTISPANKRVAPRRRDPAASASVRNAARSWRRSDGSWRNRSGCPLPPLPAAGGGPARRRTARRAAPAAAPSTAAQASPSRRPPRI